MIMRIPRPHVPLLEPEDVVRHLGKQEKHWKEGRSAHALAKLWSDSNALPSRIETALRSNQDLKSAELIDAFLERKVDLESEGRPSQTDLLAVVGIDQRLAIVAVEGKAGEPFDKRVEKWLDGSEGKDARLKALCKILGLRATLCCGSATSSCIVQLLPFLRHDAIERTSQCFLFTASVTTGRALQIFPHFCKPSESRTQPLAW